jgi:plastocyanin
VIDAGYPMAVFGRRHRPDADLEAQPNTVWRTVFMPETADRNVPVSRRSVGRGLALGVAAAVLALLAAACGGSGSGSGSTSAGSGSAPGGSSSSSGTQVTASLTEFHIALSQQTFPPGKYTFAVSNDGHATHALAINGPGLSSTQTASLSPGQKANLTVTLQAGKYDFFCPVGNHKQMGMDMNVSVAAGGGGGATTTAGGGGGGNGY